MKGTILERFTAKGSILESDKGKLPDGVLCRAKYQICSIGERNRNNRIYEKAVWDKVLADKEIQEKLKNRSLFFHAEHPATTQSNTEKVAGVVTEMTVEDNKAYATMEVLDTPYGRIVDTLLRSGCGIGVSTRADGELEECMDESGNKYSKVVPDAYKFVTVDFTADPSSYGSEVPLEVQRNVTGKIKGDVDNETIDREYATVLLEGMNAPEAKELLETMKSDKHHEGCKCKNSEKKCKGGCARAKEGVIEPELEKDVSRETVSTADQQAKLGQAGLGTQAKESIGDEDAGATYQQTYTVNGKQGKVHMQCTDKASNKVGSFIGDESGRAISPIFPDVKELFDWINQGNAVAECVDQKVKEDVQMVVDELEGKIEQFLLDNWDNFLGDEDAANNLVKVFGITSEDAKKYVKKTAEGRGTISATYESREVKSNPKIEEALKESEVKLTVLVAENKRIIENYGNDAVKFSRKINGLTVDLIESKKENASLKEQFARARQEWRDTQDMLTAAHTKALKEAVASVKDEAKKLIESLNEEHRKDTVKQYVGLKTQMMGLKVPTGVLTILESCATPKEADEVIRKFQNAITESALKFNATNEISVTEHRTVDPVQIGIDNKVEKAMSAWMGGNK